QPFPQPEQPFPGS
nr:Chain C, DQ2-glia-omega1 peptide [Homo sapiens]7SG2_H Chain H, DQ2-glia-omega1 peptide [Homo sapiens]